MMTLVFTAFGTLDDRGFSGNRGKNVNPSAFRAAVMLLRGRRSSSFTPGAGCSSYRVMNWVRA